MSICRVTMDLNDYLNRQDEANRDFTSCLPEYRDNVSNHVISLLDGERSEEEFWSVFYDWSAEEDQHLVINAIENYKASYNISEESWKFFKVLVITAIEYYSEVLYESDISSMLEDKDGTTLDGWVKSVL